MISNPISKATLLALFLVVAGTALLMNCASRDQEDIKTHYETSGYSSGICPSCHNYVTINSQSKCPVCGANLSAGFEKHETFKEVVTNDQGKLIAIAKTSEDPDLRKQAVTKIINQDVLGEVARTDKSNVVRLAAVNNPNLISQKIFAQLAKECRDFGIRRAAVGKLTDQALLVEIARTDKNEDVRESAVERISGQAQLADIYGGETDSTVRLAIVKKLADQDVLAEIGKTEKHNGIRFCVAEKLTDKALAQKILVEIAKSKDDSLYGLLERVVKMVTDEETLADIALTFSKNDNVCVAAVENPNLKDQRVFAEIAKTAKNFGLRQRAVGRLTDQASLSEIARTNEEDYIRRYAVEKLSDPTVIAEIAKNDKQEFVRRAAVENRNLIDQKLLAEIAKSDADDGVQAAAVEKLTDPTLLAKIALSDSEWHIRLSAVNNPNLTDRKVFIQILDTERRESVRSAAQERIKTSKKE